MKEEQIKDHLRNQYRLNTDISGPEWIFNITKKHRQINWGKCIKLELCEFEDSFNWKHWKDINSEDDLINAKIELSDIYHFILSSIIQKEFLVQIVINDPVHKEFPNIFDNFQKMADHKFDEINVDEEEIQKLFEEHVLNDCYVTIRNGISEAENGKNEDIQNAIDALSVLTNTISAKTYQFNKGNLSISSYINNLNNFMPSTISVFFNLCKLMDMNVNDFYEMKNTLNRFRLDNGYQDGTYEKIWNGKEDNIFMVELYEKMEKFDEEKLYQELRSIYVEI